MFRLLDSLPSINQYQNVLSFVNLSHFIHIFLLLHLPINSDRIFDFLYQCIISCFRMI